MGSDFFFGDYRPRWMRVKSARQCGNTSAGVGEKMGDGIVGCNDETRC
ncbi:hypothetical protein DPX39_010047600 [Trypanosoma brucei equiperdum]|uniref:Uncharacterized protein n=1 Tax=Trypanosoma brucei equiperdum TaxID=630700 RepID=A0A3L6LCF6_9TRYP|nr:hypothetical protein DPX39_010047600 [Trypanosoma brucei equiperdum]